MGIIHSIFCALTFCVERILTYVCCAFLLIWIMFAVLMLMIYGISVGYHYAQKELTDYAFSSNGVPSEEGAAIGRNLDRALNMRASRLADEAYKPRQFRPVPVKGRQRNLAQGAARARAKTGATRKFQKPVYRELVQKPAYRQLAEKPAYRPLVGKSAYRQQGEVPVYRQQGEEPPFRQQGKKPIVLLATERPQKRRNLATHRQDLARRVIGRRRRTNNNVTIPTSSYSKVPKHSNSTRPAGTSSRGRITAFT